MLYIHVCTQNISAERSEKLAGCAGHVIDDTLLRAWCREKLAIDLDKMLRLAAKEGDDSRCAALVRKVRYLASV